MILALDVDYRNDHAVAAGILFEHWECEKHYKQITVSLHNIDCYMPGQFYKRELPCIREVLDKVRDHIDYLIIDGFVFLGAERKPGLGKHLWDSLETKIPVIGVAKSAFKDSPSELELLRGKSKRPLYITSIGIEQDQALRFIKQMHGDHRIPTQLKKVDQLCRSKIDDLQ